MSSSAHLAWDDCEGVSGGDWATFCEAHNIVHSPNTVGGNVFYANGHSGVEIKFGEWKGHDEMPDYAERISFSTFHGGPAIPDVARLATALWLAHGGRLSADPEVRRRMVTTGYGLAGDVQEFAR